MLGKKAELTKFVNDVCLDFADEHSMAICRILESSLDTEKTSKFILNVFRRLYKNEEYTAMTQLVTCIYNIAFEFYPYNINRVQENDVALIPYCDSLMLCLESDIKILKIKSEIDTDDLI